MSTLLPVIEPTSDFISQLLRDQQSLSAVEQFSLIHDANGNGGTPAKAHTELESPRYPGADFCSAPPVQDRYYRELLPASPPGPGQQFAFEVDLDKCSGCKACVVACHTMNGLEEDEAWRRVGTVSSAEDQGRVQHVTTACHHCADPGCLSGCPVKAYDKDPVTGIVRHLDDQCIGCKYCTMMCPYEIPRYSERLGIVRKCDMCHQRLSTGEAPACVQACPNEAIAIRVVDSEPSEITRLAPGAPLSTITRPTTTYKTAHVASFNASVPQDEVIDSVAENHWPLAVMLVATQISVGILLADRLASTLMLFAGSAWPAESTRLAALLALVIGGVGLNLAPLHLGQPLRAWRVFLGLRTSWLSREAVILGKYVGLLVAATALLWLDFFAHYLPGALVDNVPDWAAGVTLSLAILAGVAGLYSSAMIYIVTRRQLWRPNRTFVRFFASAAIGGLAWTVAVAMASSDSFMLARFAASGLTLAVIAKLTWEYRIQLSPSAVSDRYDARSRRLALGPLTRLTAIRFATGASGAALAALLAVMASPSLPVLSMMTAGAVAVLLTAGEVCERLLYFSSVVYDRMPGTLR
jgi:formate dehydrogenase iron-sulfur subunit